jgi:hypothetical protein
MSSFVIIQFGSCKFSTMYKSGDLAGQGWARCLGCYQCRRNRKPHLSHCAKLRLSSPFESFRDLCFEGKILQVRFLSSHHIALDSLHFLPPLSLSHALPFRGTGLKEASGVASGGVGVGAFQSCTRTLAPGMKWDEAFARVKA